jgi:hypothetical protein
MDDAHPSELSGAASSSTHSKAKLRGAGRLVEHRATSTTRDEHRASSKAIYILMLKIITLLL